MSETFAEHLKASFEASRLRLAERVRTACLRVVVDAANDARQRAGGWELRGSAEMADTKNWEAQCAEHLAKQLRTLDLSPLLADVETLQNEEVTP